MAHSALYLALYCICAQDDSGETRECGGDRVLLHCEETTTEREDGAKEVRPSGPAARALRRTEN